jgi:hypothetical protein
MYLEEEAISYAEPSNTFVSFVTLTQTLSFILRDIKNAMTELKVSPLAVITLRVTWNCGDSIADCRIFFLISYTKLKNLCSIDSHIDQFSFIYLFIQLSLLTCLFHDALNQN